MFDYTLGALVNFWISCWFELYTWRINIIHGFGFTLIDGTLIWLFTARIFGLADWYGLNDMIID
jgi:hypothetical protein